MVQQQLDAGKFQRLAIQRATAGLLVQRLLLLGALNPSEVTRHCDSLIYITSTRMFLILHNHYITDYLKLLRTHFQMPQCYVALTGSFNTNLLDYSIAQHHKQ